ncbi:PYR4 [Auxenochlorella protothecoides x Auxenochlorella symbiontica]
MSLAAAWRRLAYVAGGASAGFLASYRHDFKQLEFDVAALSGPALRFLDGETAHNVAIWAAAHGLLPKETRPDPPSLRTTVWDRDFPNPLGLAAGFDKSAEGPEALLNLGFGFVEIGSVTPLPQPGNAKPRVFRIEEEGAVINRYGFNNDGVDAVRQRLKTFRNRQDDPSTSTPAGLLGVNLGKNKATEDAAADYCIGVAKLARLADYLVINVSSPNTPGLRALQGRRELQSLVRRVKAERDALAWHGKPAPPLLIKIAPDLTAEDLGDIAAVALSEGVDGLVVSNTTLERPPGVAAHPAGAEAGGLSGAPLFERSTAVLGQVYRLTHGRLPLIGVGGVSTGEQAYRKIRAGASLVQLYTSLALSGPALVRRVKLELAACLARDGFKSVADAVGADHRRDAQGRRA